MDGWKRLLIVVYMICCLPFFCLSATFTVKAGGGGNYTTIQACSTAMAAGDTCTVFAGTYAENVTVPAGTVGNYKTITVNGADIVTVQAFVLNSHTKLVGNCTAPAAINTCGFNIQNTASPSAAACVGMPDAATDIYITNNVMYACGNSAMISVPYPESVSYIYIQGNTLSYACVTQAQAGGANKECTSIGLEGNHILVEGNDLSHYTLGIGAVVSQGVYRKNTFHDQFETEAGGNAHTDIWFSEPGVSTFPVEYNLIEGNAQYNAVGANAKGVLSQGETCGGVCFNLINRFNTFNRLGSGNVTNDTTWTNVKLYNNTEADTGADQAFSCGNPPITDNSTAVGGQATSGTAVFNNLYYFNNSAATSGCFNAYSCSTSSGSTCVQGHNLVYCAGGCGTVYGHLYQTGTFLSEPGNISANPLFVTYVSPGSTSNNYSLQAGSPALNAGTFLTTVASGDSGSGTSLVVNDASYFQDSFGLSAVGVQADCISITTVGNHVCITAVNYSTNTLTMASGFSRSSGDSVWLYSDSSGTVQLVGSAPNIGAKMQAGAPSTSGSSLPANTSLVGPGTIR